VSFDVFNLDVETDSDRHPNPNPSPFCMEWKQVSVILVVVRYGSLLAGRVDRLV